MQRLEISTDVYLPREDIYEFLVDFPQYARYSEHLDRVEQHGDGGPGTEYDLVFSWWKLSYTARSRVTGVEHPARIDWQIIKDISARGHWRVETTAPDEPDPTRDETISETTADDETTTEDETTTDDETAGEDETTVDEETATDGTPADDETPADNPVSEVYFVVEFDTSSADSNVIDIPRFISFDAVLDRVIPKIQAEATAIVERIVADLEGEQREVELRVHETPSL